MELAKSFEPSDIEKFCRSEWEKRGYYTATTEADKPSFSIQLPPPNVTGVLHMGHMLNNTIQDLLIRRARMRGFNACWVPGTDHASIATEAKVVQKLRKEGIKKSDLSRDAFLEHDRTATSGTVTREIPLDQFPTPEELWSRYCAAKGWSQDEEKVATEAYYDDGSQKSPRYYQLNAINRTVAAIARGQKRCLLVMATGTGKTYTAFQIIWRLWKSRAKKRILFLVDRNILADQTKTNDFKPFGQAMTKITTPTMAMVVY